MPGLDPVCGRPATVQQATILIIVVGLTWRAVRYALSFPLWGDEAFVAASMIERDFASLWRPPEFFQIVPPGFLWAGWLAAHWLGPSEWALRLPAFCAGTTSLLLFWSFCSGVTTRRTTLVAVAILAASFFPVRHAVEVKPYSSDMFVSLSLIAAAWTTYRRPHSAERWAIAIFAAVAGVWFSYPAIFPATAAAALLGTRAVRMQSPRVMTFWVGYCATLIASWCMMYLRFAGPQADAAWFLADLKTWRDAFPPVAEPWRLPWWFVRIHTGAMLAYPHGGPDFGSTATSILVVVGGVRMARRRARRPLLGLLLAPLAPALLAAAFRRYPYGTSARVMLYMAPAFCLLAAEGLLAVLRLRRLGSPGPIVAAVALGVFAIGGTIRDAVRPYFGFDTVLQRSSARRLASSGEPGDEYAVYNGVTPPPEIPDLMITRWLQRVAMARYNLRVLLPGSVRWEPDPSTVNPQENGRVWLIVQRHGDERFFSEPRLAGYEAVLTSRLGQPQFFDRFELPGGETWTIAAYPRRRTPGSESRRQRCPPPP